MIKTITFEGHEFEYEQREAKSYRNIKRIARAKEDPNVVFDVAESLFCGKDEEYAELLDDDFGKFGELIGAVFTNEGEAAKN